MQTLLARISIPHTHSHLISCVFCTDDRNGAKHTHAKGGAHNSSSAGKKERSAPFDSLEWYTTATPPTWGVMDTKAKPVSVCAKRKYRVLLSFESTDDFEPTAQQPSHQSRAQGGGIQRVPNHTHFEGKQLLGHCLLCLSQQG